MRPRQNGQGPPPGEDQTRPMMVRYKRRRNQKILATRWTCFTATRLRAYANFHEFYDGLPRPFPRRVRRAQRMLSRFATQSTHKLAGGLIKIVNDSVSDTVDTQGQDMARFQRRVHDAQFDVTAITPSCILRVAAAMMETPAGRALVQET